MENADICYARCRYLLWAMQISALPCADICVLGGIFMSDSNHQQIKSNLGDALTKGVDVSIDLRKKQYIYFVFS